MTTATSEPTASELRRASRAATTVGLVLPAVVIAVSALVQLSWLHRLPNPAAIHWNGAGYPDGYGAPWLNLVVFTATAAGLLVLPLVQTLGVRRKVRLGEMPTWAAAHRALPAFVLGVVVSMQVNAVGSAAVQLDAPDASRTGSTLGWIIGGWAAGIAIGLIAYALQPAVRRNAEDGEPAAAPLPLSPTERAAWVGDVVPGRGVLIGLGVLLVLLAAMTVWMFTVAPGAGVVSLAALALVGVSMPLCMWFRVRVSPEGLEARSLAGWPVFRVPAGEVQDVLTAHTDPLGEFGGWGLRFAGGRTGIISRAGESLIVHRADGRTLVITVAGAADAAAVLQAAALAARTTGGEAAATDTQDHTN